MTLPEAELVLVGILTRSVALVFVLSTKNRYALPPQSGLVHVGIYRPPYHTLRHHGSGKAINAIATGLIIMMAITNTKKAKYTFAEVLG